MQFGPPDFSSLGITSRPQLYLRSRDKNAAKSDKQPHGWPQDQLHWLMTPCPGINRSVIGDLEPERTHMENCWIFYWDLSLGPPLTSPPLQPFGQGPRVLSLPLPRAPPCFPSFSSSPQVLSTSPFSLLSFRGPSLASITCFLSPFLLRSISAISVIF